MNWYRFVDLMIFLLAGVAVAVSSYGAVYLVIALVLAVVYARWDAR